MPSSVTHQTWPARIHCSGKPAQCSCSAGGNNCLPVFFLQAARELVSPPLPSRCRQRCKLMCAACSRRKRLLDLRNSSSSSSRSGRGSSQAGSRCPSSSRGHPAAAAPAQRLRNCKRTVARPRCLLLSAVVLRPCSCLLQQSGPQRRHHRQQQLGVAGTRLCTSRQQQGQQGQGRQRRRRSLPWRQPLGVCSKRRRRRRRGAPGV